jgi:Zn ribbon nucleic-acid-binding protein
MQHFALAICERGSSISMHRGVAGAGLPAPDSQIAITGINLDGAGCASCPLCGHEDRAAPAERVKNEIAAARTVTYRVSNQADRLWRGVMSLRAGPLDLPAAHSHTFVRERPCWPSSKLFKCLPRLHFQRKTSSCRER